MFKNMIGKNLSIIDRDLPTCIGDKLYIYSRMAMAQLTGALLSAYISVFYDICYYH